MSEDRIPRIITKLYALVDELQELYPYRKFTLDGHLVGSIGEVVAEYLYDLRLVQASTGAYDALTKTDLRKVQIKLTAGRSVSLAVHDQDPDILVVLHINRILGFEEIYNGQYPSDILEARKESKRAVKTLSLSQLKRAQGDRSLNDEGRIKTLNSYFQKGIE